MAAGALRPEHLRTLRDTYSQLSSLIGAAANVMDQDPQRKALIETYLCSVRDLHVEASKVLAHCLRLGGFEGPESARLDELASATFKP